MFFLSAIQAQQLLEIIERQEPGAQRVINARVCSANHLARRVVYELDISYSPSEERQPVLVFDEDGTVRQYAVQFVDTKHLGIVPYLLTPVDPNNCRVHLVFRGSKDAPAWCRSTEMPAPGCESFYEERLAILSALQRALEVLAKDKYHLLISGHSLGGSDAQTCATTVMQLRVERHKDPKNFQEYALLDKIETLTVNHANSGGILLNTARDSKIAAEYLARHNLLTIQVMCVLTAGDVVQQTGQSHMLADVPASVAKVELVKLSSEYEGYVNKKYIIPAVLTLPFTYLGCAAYALYVTRNAIAAHKQRFFDNADFKSQVFKMYDNTTEQGRAKILAKLSKHPLDNAVVHHTMYYLHALQARFTTTQRRVTHEQHFVLIEAADCIELPNAASAIPQQQKAAIGCVIS